MKALFIESVNNLKLKEISYPVLPEGGAILNVKASAICGTDLKILKFGHSRIKFPWILGHEVSGIIEEVDDPSGYYKVGDRVVLNPTVYCGNCYYCKRGMYNICLDPDSYGYERPGGFSEFMAIQKSTVLRRELYHLPPSMDFDLASITEPFACVINGHKDIHIEPDSNVLIIGGGPIGIMHTIYSKKRGAKAIFLYDTEKIRIKMALSFPHIDCAFFSEEELRKAIMDETKGIGPDLVIVAAPSFSAQNFALQIIRKRGEVLFFAGIPHGKSEGVLDTNLIHYKELKVFGSSNCRGLEMEEALSFISYNKPLFEKLITERYPIDRAQEAFLSAFSPATYKVIINP